MGRRSIHRKPMTATERQRRWRAKKRRAQIWLGDPDPSARWPTPKRADKDFWPTPPELQVALIRYVLPLLPEGPVWECAAGDGVLADALIRAGREVIQSDIDPQRRGIMQLDFLKAAPPLATRGSILATNPPFNRIDAFTERALQLLDAGYLKAVVLLYRADKANTQERIEVFNRAAHELTITARTKWVPGSGGSERSPRWWFIWIIWLADKEGPPVNRRINRADLASLSDAPPRACGGRWCGFARVLAARRRRRHPHRRVRRAAPTGSPRRRWPTAFPGW
jgi:hypothetical protein